jgi:hypothetical protein
VEVLSWGTSRVGNARSIDEDIPCDAKGASSSDSIVTSTRKPIRSNGLSATLEVGVEISEARIIRACVCIAVEGNSCLEKWSISYLELNQIVSWSYKFFRIMRNFINKNWRVRKSNGGVLYACYRS